MELSRLRALLSDAAPSGAAVVLAAAAGAGAAARHGRRRAGQTAARDPLTGLPNRVGLEEHIALALARSRRTGTSVALLHIDLDAFKIVNDSLGHAAGDALLCRVAARLESATRATDVLARMSGDEFLLLAADIEGDEVLAAETVAANILQALHEPFAAGDGEEIQITASIGISLAPRDAADPTDLLAHADTAMYRAKAVARGGSTFFTADPADPLTRLSLAARLRRALGSGEFLLHYQPIFSLASGRLEGVEALLRWNDPDRGLVPPGDFIPLCEETGLIEALGDWVVGAVCAQQVEWAAEGFHPMISFNVSPRQLRRQDFSERVAHHLASTGADPAKLTAELTESAAMDSWDEADSPLHALHALGLQLALDDFGSGFSSLARLRELPVETLKIDRAFLRQVPEDPQATALVSAIISLAAALGRTAVAEGIEREEQRAFLSAQRCPLAQGFALGRPAPPEDIRLLLQHAAGATLN